MNHAESITLSAQLMDGGHLGGVPLTLMRAGAHSKALPPELKGFIHPNIKTYSFWAAQADEAPPSPSTTGDYGIALGRIRGQGTFYHQSPTPLSGIKVLRCEARKLFVNTTLKSTSDVHIESLDRLIMANNLPQPDVLEIDSPGAAGDIIRGASWTLRRHTLAVYVRTSLFPIFEDDGTAAEVDILLRDRGFRLFRLEVESTVLPGRPLLFQRAIYLRTPKPPAIVRFACVAALMGQGDLANTLLRRQGEILSERPDEVDSEIQQILGLGFLTPEQCLVEIGAESGHNTRLMFQAGLQVLPTDPQPKNVDTLKERFPDNNARVIDFASGRGLDGESFDGVICLGALNDMDNLGDLALALERLGDMTDSFLILSHNVSEDEGQGQNKHWLTEVLYSCFSNVYEFVTDRGQRTTGLNGPNKKHPILWLASRDPIQSNALRHLFSDFQRSGDASET